MYSFVTNTMFCLAFGQVEVVYKIMLNVDWGKQNLSWVMSQGCCLSYTVASIGVP